MQYAICRHAISLNIILVKPTKCTLSKMHKMHIGILARMPFLAPTSYPLCHHQIRPNPIHPFTLILGGGGIRMVCFFEGIVVYPAPPKICSSH